MRVVLESSQVKVVCATVPCLSAVRDRDSRYVVTGNGVIHS